MPLVDLRGVLRGTVHVCVGSMPRTWVLTAPTRAGYKTISLNINWLDPVTCTPQHACLGVARYKSLDPNAAEQVIQGTATDLGAWVQKKLKEFHLVPSEQLSIAITKFVRAACTDNASAEVKAVVGVLQLPHEPCVCHTLDLIVGFGVQPSITTKARSDHAEAVASAEAAGDEPPDPLETPLNMCIDRLASIAKYCKKGKGMALFYEEQRRRGVATPRSLISRAQTRWSNAVAMMTRAVMLRQFMAFICNLAGKGHFTSTDWAIMVQCVSLLQLFADAIKALQSRTLLIGEHVGHVYFLVRSIMNPQTSGVKLMPYNLEPTIEQLNTRGFSLDEFAEITPAPANMAQETNAVLERLQRNVRWRLGDPSGGPNPKFQLNSDVTMQALFFDPALKYLVTDDSMESNLMFSGPRKTALASFIISKGKALATEMYGTAGTEDEPNNTDEDVPVAKQAKLDPRSALLQAHTRAPAAVAARADASRTTSPAEARFLNEFKRWKAYPLQDISMSAFWSSSVAKSEFPIIRRMFLSICSTRPDNAELERNFSALGLLLSPQRRGRMSWRTVERKMFLVLNKHHWRPLPDVPDDDPYFHELLVAVKLAQPKPKSDAERAGAPPEPPVVLASPLDAVTFLSDSDDDE